MSTLYVDEIAGIASADTVAIPGHVIQVVQTVKSDTFSATTTSFTDITGLSASITPSSTANKILVLVEVKFNGQACERCYFRLLQGSTAISIGDAASSRPRISAGGNQVQSTYDLDDASIMFLDSPSTTSATTYKIQGRGLNASGNFHVNKTNADRDTADYEPRSSSSITLMEIAG